MSVTSAMSSDEAIWLSERHNDKSRLLTLPGEIRNQIYALAVGEGQHYTSRHTGTRLPFFSDHHDALTGLLSACKRLRQEGLAFFYKHNQVRLHYRVGLCSEVDSPQWVSLGQVSNIYYPRDITEVVCAPPIEIATPSIVFQASRSFKINARVDVFAQPMLCSHTHEMGVSIVVDGDEFSCKSWVDCDGHDEIFNGFMVDSVAEMRTNVIRTFLDKMKHKNGQVVRKLRLVSASIGHADRHKIVEESWPGNARWIN